MHPDTADLAMKNLERLIARDPLLRDIVNPTLPNSKRRARFSPAVDVIETDAAWTVLVEVPGVPRDSLKVRLDGTRLTVTGDKPTRREGKAPVVERETGPFRREFLIPFQVRPEAIRARLEDGVLEIVLPRAGKSAVREVPIESGAQSDEDDARE